MSHGCGGRPCSGATAAPPGSKCDRTAANRAEPAGLPGGGIAVGGGTENVIIRNRVQGHPAYGIGLVSLNPFEPERNRVEGNVLSDNAVDLLYQPSSSVNDPADNCFGGNQFTTSSPDSIESVLGCDATPKVTYPVPVPSLPSAPAGVDYRTISAPDPQPSMPDPTGPAVAVPDQPTFPDLATITVPPAP